MPASREDSLVVKVGGSLYNLPDLGPRLRRWLATRETSSVLLVPGGGTFANSVREVDALHHLGEEAAHWLAMRTLTVAAHFLVEMLPGAVVVSHPDEWQPDTLAVLDPHAFAVADEGRVGALPHSWAVTSDSIAARAARVATASQLVLLKSVTILGGTGWHEAARRACVDEFFPEAVQDDLLVRCVNLREY